MEEALVIIDVQEGFKPCALKVENSVVRLVEEAKAAGHAIFVVGLRGSGPSVLPLQRALRGYPLAYRVRKHGQNGCKVLADTISLAWKRGDVQHFSKVTFCGLYTSMCVQDTFLGLCKIAARSKGVDDRTALSPATVLCVDGRATYEGWGSNRVALKHVRAAQVEIGRRFKFRPI